MRPKKMGRKARQIAGPAATTVVVLCLYVVDSAPNSIQAIANLEAICKEHLHDNYRLEVVDVLQCPARALADGVVVTPSLSKLSPFPGAKIIGNLSDRSSVLRALGIPI